LYNNSKQEWFDGDMFRTNKLGHNW